MSEGPPKGRGLPPVQQALGMAPLVFQPTICVPDNQNGRPSVLITNRPVMILENSFLQGVLGHNGSFRPNTRAIYSELLGVSFPVSRGNQKPPIPIQPPSPDSDMSLALLAPSYSSSDPPTSIVPYSISGCATGYSIQTSPASHIHSDEDISLDHPVIHETNDFELPPICCDKKLISEAALCSAEPDRAHSSIPTPSQSHTSNTIHQDRTGTQEVLKNKFSTTQIIIPYNSQSQKAEADESLLSIPESPPFTHTSHAELTTLQCTDLKDLNAATTTVTRNLTFDSQENMTPLHAGHTDTVTQPKPSLSNVPVPSPTLLGTQLIPSSQEALASQPILCESPKSACSPQPVCCLKPQCSVSSQLMPLLHTQPACLPASSVSDIPSLSDCSPPALSPNTTRVHTRPVMEPLTVDTISLVPEQAEQFGDFSSLTSPSSSQIETYKPTTDPDKGAVSFQEEALESEGDGRKDTHTMQLQIGERVLKTWAEAIVALSKCSKATNKAKSETKEERVSQIQHPETSDTPQCQHSQRDSTLKCTTDVVVSSSQYRPAEVSTLLYPTRLDGGGLKEMNKDYKGQSTNEKRREQPLKVASYSLLNSSRVTLACEEREDHTLYESDSELEMDVDLEESETSISESSSPSNVVPDLPKEGYYKSLASSDDTALVPSPCPLTLSSSPVTQLKEISGEESELKFWHFSFPSANVLLQDGIQSEFSCGKLSSMSSHPSTPAPHLPTPSPHASTPPSHPPTPPSRPPTPSSHSPTPPPHPPTPPPHPHPSTPPSHPPTPPPHPLTPLHPPTPPSCPPTPPPHPLTPPPRPPTPPPHPPTPPSHPPTPSSHPPAPSSHPPAPPLLLSTSLASSTKQRAGVVREEVSNTLPSRVGTLLKPLGQVLIPNNHCSLPLSLGKFAGAGVNTTSSADCKVVPSTTELQVQPKHSICSPDHTPDTGIRVEMSLQEPLPKKIRLAPGTESTCYHCESAHLGARSGEFQKQSPEMLWAANSLRRESKQQTFVQSHGPSTPEPSPLGHNEHFLSTGGTTVPGHTQTQQHRTEDNRLKLGCVDIHEPREDADDGLDTVCQEVPRENSREHALVPNMVLCQRGNERNSHNDSDDQCGSGAVVPVASSSLTQQVPRMSPYSVPAGSDCKVTQTESTARAEDCEGIATIISSEQSFCTRAINSTLSQCEDKDSIGTTESPTHAASVTVKCDQQMVPESSFNDSLNTSGFYEEQEEAEKAKSKLPRLEDINIDDLDGPTALSIVLESLDNKGALSSTEEIKEDVVEWKEHGDESGKQKSLPHTRSQYQEWSSVFHSNGLGRDLPQASFSKNEIVQTTRLNLSRPRLRLGLSRKQNCFPLHPSREALLRINTSKDN